MSDKSLDKQFAGNYVRLINQCRELQSDITVKDKMIELMAQNINDSIAYMATSSCYFKDNITIISDFKTRAISELVAEQNKKAADNASI